MLTVVALAALKAFAAPPMTVAVLLTVVAPEKVLEPVVVFSVVVPPFAVSDAEPPIPSTVPPFEPIAPESEPCWIAPPDSVTLLIVCAKPPRSTTPPVLIVSRCRAERVRRPA